MVLKKLLSSLGFGGVEVDTVLSAPITRPGEPLTGQVHLRAKSDVEITSIALLVVATAPGHGFPAGEIELGRHVVAHGLRLTGGSTEAVPFAVATPFGAPVTMIYGQALPGISVGVRTEVRVASGSARTDFDPAGVEPSTIHQRILDALGTIGCRFAGCELRPGGAVGLPVGVAQSITFYAPVPPGEPVGPHIPRLVFTFAGDMQGLTVVSEVAARPGVADRHRVTPADLENASPSFVDMVDGWVREALRRLDEPASAPAGAFLQQVPARGHQGYGQQSHARAGHQPYAYAGQQSGYRYGGYRGGGAGSMIAAGVGGAALGFLGGMVISDLMTPDLADPAAMAGDAAGGDGGSDGGGEIGGGEFGGGDFGGGDFGGDFGGEF